MVRVAGDERAGGGRGRGFGEPRPGGGAYGIPFEGPHSDGTGVGDPGGKKRVFERKIFPGYIMVHMEVNEGTWYLIRETPGIGDFVGSSNKPLPMPAHEVDRILASMEEKQGKPKPKIEFHKGESVKIKEGPFENFDGVVDEVNTEKGTVNIIVSIFGRPTPVELEYWQVEPL